MEEQHTEASDLNALEPLLEQLEITLALLRAYEEALLSDAVSGARPSRVLLDALTASARLATALGARYRDDAPTDER